MKNLYLARHAKSNWNSPGLNDIDRPLDGGGQRDATFMGTILAGLLAGQGETVQLIMTSPARRAESTAKYFAEALGMAAADIRVEKDIYNAGPDTLHDLIFAIDDDVGSAMLVGHNPGMTQLAASLSSKPVTPLHTCSIVALRFPIQNWRLVKAGTGTLMFIENPKRHLE